MKKIVSILVFASFVLWANAQTVISDANAEQREVPAFRAIQVSHAIDVHLTQGDEDAVAVSARKEEDRDKIRTEVENGVLKIWYDESKFWKNTGDKRLRAYVSVRKLDQLTASGASDVMVNGRLQVDELELNLSGASDFKGVVEGNTLRVDQSGASDVTISGRISRLKVEASGASDFKGYDLEVDRCQVNASGASDIKVTVNGEISAQASGASGVHYKGSGVVREMKSSGASSISKKG